MWKEEYETDVHRIAQRQKQINIWKDSDTYVNYLAHVPKDKRNPSLAHPVTPRPEIKRSKRSFDGLMRQWRSQMAPWFVPLFIPDQTLERQIICSECGISAKRMFMCDICEDALCGDVCFASHF